MYKLIRSLLFRLDPETAHKLTLQLIRTAGMFPPSYLLLNLLYWAPRRPVQAFGMSFRNPVGLAAGYDKDAMAIRGLSALGFGHLEVGTVTPRPQPGNPRPRLFRLVEDQAIINRLGFPGQGSESMLENLQQAQKGRFLRPKTVIGVNIGKNKDTPNEQAVLDYLALLQIFAPHAGYLAINISSPNTAGLRQLQGRTALEALLSQLDIQRSMEERMLNKRVPLLVKLAPDLSESELDDAVDVILRTHMDGIIATNTTLARDGLTSEHRGETGGLSGSPLRARSEAVLCQIVKRVDGKIPVVSVGGIMTAEDARKRLDLGATLIQVYTGLVYQGPGLIKKIQVER
jgi:dihydroorotate dehydrogenase